MAPNGERIANAQGSARHPVPARRATTGRRPLYMDSTVQAGRAMCPMAGRSLGRPHKVNRIYS